MTLSRLVLAAGMSVVLMLGIVLGFLLADQVYRRAIMNLGHFAARMIGKAFLRTLSTSSTRILAQVDEEYSILSAAEKRKHADPSALQAVREFHERLKPIFGEELSASYFFGSRMRGSYMYWSDLDVVIFFGSGIPLAHARRHVWREAFYVLLRHGSLIQPRLVNDQTLDAMVAGSHPLIRRAIATGIRFA